MMIDQNYQIEKTINTIIQNVNNIPHHNTSVFFMGQSGSGKGTLINYLIKNAKLHAELAQTGDMIIILQKKFDTLQNSQEDGIQISQKMNSQTSIPKQTQYKGQIFKDFPGFHDNRQQKSSLNQDIINQFYIKDVFTKTNKFKIVFLTSKAGISDRGTQFLHSIRVFSKQFKDIKPILKSICLVVTKVPKEIQITHIKASLLKIQTQLIQDLSQNQKSLLNHFVEDSRIQLFYYPQKTGNLDFSHSIKIKKTIQSLQYSHLTTQISINIQNNSHKKLHKLIQNWNNKISHLVGQYLQTSLKQYILKQFLKFQLIEINKKTIQKYMNYLEELQSIQNQDYFRFGQILFDNGQHIQIHNQCTQNEELFIKIQNKFQQYYRFLQFFKFFASQSFNLIKWKEKIHRIKNYLYQILQPPRFQQHFIKDLNELRIYVKSFYGESSQIQQYINKNTVINTANSSLKIKIIVISYILNLNTNLIIPGTDLIFISNFINIPNEILIDLKGNNAQDLQGQSEINSDGVPGLPGQNGGTLIIKSLHHSLELKKINIDLRGGVGGKGRNGGLIKIPQKSNYLKMLRQQIQKSTENKQFLIQRANYKFSDKKFIGKLFHLLRSLGTFNDQVLQKYSTINYEKQKFVQTVGGCNGINGYMGKLDIGKIPYNIELKNIKNQAKIYGYKQVYQGIYLKQMIFPSIRKEGRTPIKQKSKSQQQESSTQNHKSNQNHKYLTQNSKNYLESSNQCKTERSTKNSLKTNISEFSLDPQKQQQNIQNQFYDQKISKHQEKSLANSLNSIKNQKDFQTQILLSLFKFNDMRSKQNKHKQLETIQEKDQLNLIKRKHKQSIFTIPKSQIQKQQNQNFNHKDLEIKDPHFVRRKNEIKTLPNVKLENKNTHSQLQNHLKIIQKNKNSPLKANSFQAINQSIVQQENILLKDSRQFGLRHSQTMGNPFSNPQLQRKQSLISYNKLSRSLTFNNQFNQKKLRKKYLQTNFQTLSKSQLLELIRLRAQSKQEIIVSNQQRDKFALMISKEILNQFGKEIATDIGTQVIQNVGKDIVNGVTNQVVQNTGKVIGKQILIKSTEGISKSYIGHQIGKETIKQFSQVFSKQSFKQISKKASQATVSNASIQYGIAQTLLGISKSFILQSIISAVLASGITDKWLIQPHFESKKIQSDTYNDKQIIKPLQKQAISQQQMDQYWQQYQKLMDNYQKIFNYLCQ